MSTELAKVIGDLQVEVSGEPSSLDISELKCGDFVTLLFDNERVCGLVVLNQNQILCVEGGTKNYFVSRFSYENCTKITRFYSCKNDQEFLALRKIMLKCFKRACSQWEREDISNITYTAFIEWQEKKDKPVISSWWSKLIS